MRSTVAAILAMASTVSAHATMYGVWVNGEDQGDGRNDYIRSPPSNSPVKDLSSPDLICNVNGATAVPGFVSAAAGDTLSFEWYHDSRGDDIIDASHEGPIITYIAEYTDGDGTGAIWSKIAEVGYDGAEWAVDKLIANAGKQDLDLPADLAAGQYLIRQEIIALHEADAAYADNEARGAQFYPSCVQVEVTGSGSVVPDEGFDINTGYSEDDTGIIFNLYGDFSGYDTPGPDVWTGAGGSGGTEPPATTTAAAGSSATQAPSVTPAPGTTLSTVTKPFSNSTIAAPSSGSGAITTAITPIVPAPTDSDPAPTDDTPAPISTEGPTTPTGGCSRRKRSAKSKKSSKAKKDQMKRLAADAEKMVRRVGRPQL